MSTERVIVVRSIAPRLLSAIRSLLSSGAPAVRAGDEGRLGALFNEDVAKRLVGMLDSAKEGGAKIVFGEGKREGAVVQPHLLTSVKEGMELWEEEQFGPGALPSDLLLSRSADGQIGYSNLCHGSR